MRLSPPERVAAVCSTGIVAYKTSKAGVNAYTQSLAIGNARYGIRANVIMPGLMNTPMAIEGISKQAGIPKDELVRQRDAQVQEDDRGTLSCHQIVPSRSRPTHQRRNANHQSGRRHCDLPGETIRSRAPNQKGKAWGNTGGFRGRNPQAWGRSVARGTSR